MNDSDKRAYVLALYPGPRWRDRVKRMSDAQITAIYLAKQQIDLEKKQKEKEKDDGIPF